jgi:hypothetical protein
VSGQEISGLIGVNEFLGKNLNVTKGENVNLQNSN